MTLDAIKVKDFQSIQSGEVELGSFTVFTGPSSSGKSAFMRAAQAITRNSFVPTQVSQWAKESHVSMEIDGHTVEAIRGRSKSTYKLDGEEFTKAGRSVPPQVEEVFKLPLISEMESTFATQFEKPFLIAEPGAVASRVLGSLTNVSILHDGLKETNRRSLESRNLLKTRISDLSDANEKFEEFEHVPQMRKELDSLEQLTENLNESLATLTRLSFIATSVEKLTRELEEIESVGDVEGASQKFEALTLAVTEMSHLHTLLTHVASLAQQMPKFPFSDVEALVEEVPSFLTLSDQLASLHHQVRTYQKLESALPDWDVDAVPDSTAVQDMKKTLDKSALLKTLLGEMSSKATSYKEVSNQVKESTEKISELQHEHDTLLESYDTCPLCGNHVQGAVC